MNTKKYFIFGIFTAILILSIPAITHAIDLGGDLASDAAKKAGYAAATETTFAETVGVVIKTALSFVGVIFLTLTVYAGFLWMLARGDEGKIEKSQDIIRGAVIGLIITVGAYSITSFVVPKIVGKTSGAAQSDILVGCCILEDASGNEVGRQRIEDYAACENLVLDGCADQFSGQYQDCEHMEVPADQCN